MSRTGPASPRVKQDAPEATIATFYDALNRADIGTLETVLEESDLSNQQSLREMRSGFERGAGFQVSNVRTKMVENDGKTARLYAMVHQKILLKGETIVEEDGSSEFTLMSKGGRWFIIGYGMQDPPGWSR